MSDYRQKAMDAVRDAEATDRPDRKLRLLSLAQAWLELADHEQRVRDLAAQTSDMPGSDESSCKH